MTTTPTLNIDLDTRWILYRLGIPGVDALIENWPNTTPDEIRNFAAWIHLMAGHLADALLDLDYDELARGDTRPTAVGKYIADAIVALNDAGLDLGIAMHAHPNPDIRAMYHETDLP